MLNIRGSIIHLVRGTRSAASLIFLMANYIFSSSLRSISFAVLRAPRGKSLFQYINPVMDMVRLLLGLKHFPGKGTQLENIPNFLPNDGVAREYMYRKFYKQK